MSTPEVLEPYLYVVTTQQQTPQQGQHQNNQSSQNIHEMEQDGDVNRSGTQSFKKASSSILSDENEKIGCWSSGGMRFFLWIFFGAAILSSPAIVLIILVYLVVIIKGSI
jgi:hypothetical protein